MKKDKSKYYLAYYSPNDDFSSTKLFKTKKHAEKYIISRCCKDCQREGLYSACAAEWLIIRYDRYLKVNNYTDLMKAAGWKRIK